MKQSDTAKKGSTFIQSLLFILKSNLNGDEKIRTVSITFDTEQKKGADKKPSGKIPVVFSKVSTQASAIKSAEAIHQSVNQTTDEPHPAKQEINRTHIKTVYLNEVDFNKQPDSSPLEPEPPFEATLSIREKEIIQILAEGFNHKMIADRLGISINTVRNHFRRIHSKLHVHSNTEVLLKSLKSGIIKARTSMLFFYLVFNSFIAGFCCTSELLFDFL
jgi:DNA-binding CsgD family transcriptional regulator